VGMSCRFPSDVNSTGDFFRSLCNGDNHVRLIPPEWGWNENSLYLEKAAVLSDYTIESFDPSYFGLNSVEVETMDPHQRVLLEVNHEALRNANMIDIESITQKDIGVYVGMCNNNWVAMKTHEAVDQGGTTAVNPYMVSYMYLLIL
jgi:acyl transferase domain-containing protein